MLTSYIDQVLYSHLVVPYMSMCIMRFPCSLHDWTGVGVGVTYSYRSWGQWFPCVNTILKPAMIIYYAIIHTGGLRGGSGTLLVKTYIFGL